MGTKNSEGWSTDARKACVDMISDSYLVYPESTGKRGWGVPCAPIVKLPIIATPADIAQAVLVALDASRNQWPPSPEVKEDWKGLLRAMGLRSQKKYDPVALVSVVKFGTGPYHIDAMVRDGAGHGPLSTRAMVVPTGASIKMLAEKLMKAITKSEAAYRPRRW